MSDFLEELFKQNQNRIDNVEKKVNEVNENTVVSQFTYGFIESTLSEAQEFTLTKPQVRFITNARKSGETAGNGTGLPAFWDNASSQWVDFMGNVITV